MPPDIEFSIGTADFGDVAMAAPSLAKRIAQRVELGQPESTPIIPTRLYSMRLPLDTMLRVDTLAELSFRSRVQTVNELLMAGLDAMWQELSKEARQKYVDALNEAAAKACNELHQKEEAA